MMRTVRHRIVPAAAATLALLAAACTVESHPTAGVRVNPRGDAVVLAPRCTDERVEAVQVADLEGTVRWRVESSGNEYPRTFIVGREPPLMREVAPLEGSLAQGGVYVATVEYAGTLPGVDVEFRPSSLSTDRVIDADGDARTPQEFADESDLGCIGGWLWVFGGVVLVVALAIVAAFVTGLVVVVMVVRKARREREPAETPGRPDLSDR